jgi:uroporphyrinogen decarboxylase
MYSVTNHGVSVKAAPVSSGTTQFAFGPIAEPADWTRLSDVSPTRGVLRDQVEAVRLVRSQLGPDTPILQTIFSPLTMAAKMVGGDLTMGLENEGALHEALARVSHDVIAFGQASLEAGADGFFFATQQAARGSSPMGCTTGSVSPTTFRSWCGSGHARRV